MLVIRDPAHTYIKFNRLEHLVLDTRLMQRLRHVKQNAFCFYTYPTCQTSRFEHSIGVMEFGHIFVNSIFENSEKTSLQAFIKDYKNLICFVENNIQYKNVSSQNVKDDIMSGVGLACLVHDA